MIFCETVIFFILIIILLLLVNIALKITPTEPETKLIDLTIGISTICISGYVVVH